MLPDFGLEVLSGLVAQCKFPWLMSNVIDNETGRPLGDGRITHPYIANGHKIGLIGLVEQVSVMSSLGVVATIGSI